MLNEIDQVERGFFLKDINRNAQVSVEYLTITGILILAVGLFFAVSMLYYLDANEARLAQTSMQTLASAADQASGLGDGTVVVATIELPNGVSSMIASGKTVDVRVASGSITRDFYATSQSDINALTFNVNPPKAGKHYMRVRYVGGVSWIEELP